jgi:hypothetical protein
MSVKQHVTACVHVKSTKCIADPPKHLVVGGWGADLKIGENFHIILAYCDVTGRSEFVIGTVIIGVCHSVSLDSLNQEG